MQFNSLLKQSSIFLTIISQLVFSGSMAKAEIQSDQLPSRKPETETRTSGGSRGECAKIDNSITLIVPKNSKTNAPKTISPRPTFSWHMEKKSNLPIKFTLVEPGQNLYIKEFSPSEIEKGFATLTIPETVPALEIGKKYRWTVSFLCSRQHPSRNPFAEASILRVLPSPMLKIKSNINCDTYEKAEIWYDAVACRLKNQSTANLSVILTK